MKASHITNRCASIVTFLITCLAAPHLLAQSNEPIEATQIYKNVDFVAVAQLSSLRKHLDEESKEDYDFLVTWLTDLSGLEADKCTEVLCQFGADDYGGNGFESVGFCFRREGDFGKDEIEEFVDQTEMEAEDYEDASIYSRGREPGFYFKSNSMLIAERARIKQLIETEKSEMNRDVPFLENVSKTADLCVAVNLEKDSFREHFIELFDELRFFRRRGGENVDSSGFEALSEQVSTANLVLNLDDETNLELRMAVKDASDVDSAKENTVEFVKNAADWVSEITDELNGAPAALQESMGEFLGIITEMLEGAVVTVEGDEIVVTAKHDNATALPGLFATGMRAILSFG